MGMFSIYDGWMLIITKSARTWTLELRERVPTSRTCLEGSICIDIAVLFSSPNGPAFLSARLQNTTSLTPRSSFFTRFKPNAHNSCMFRMYDQDLS